MLPPDRPTAPAAKLPYESPRLERYGTATDLTKARAMIGAMDGGSNNSRTG
jgi:hypothetical protein